QESKRTHGWYVRVRYLGKTHSKFFSDKKCGGKDSALLSAISWRNDTEKKIGKPRTDRHVVTVSNTPTGVVGVRLNEKLGRYEVSWIKEDGRQGKTSVSVAKHGKKKAFEKACEIRKQKEAERLSL
ncbi:MAG: AP2/ERF family transcription factor, partial [Desulfurivibrionaceae bacterium]